MKIIKLLLDECVPRRLKREFIEHEVFTVEDAGLTGLENGNLICAADVANFDVLITVDKSIEHQQNKRALPLAIVILVAYSNRFEQLKPLIIKFESFGEN